MLSRPAVRLLQALCAIAACAAQSAETTPPATPAQPPAKPGFFKQLGNAVKQGVQDGVSNGVQSSGRVTIVGYTMQYSKLQRREIPAYCLNNADTGKLITVAPMFGTPYQRPDGATGFTALAVPVDANHDRVEVNLQGVLPGLSCADLIAGNKLYPYAADPRPGTPPVAAPRARSGAEDDADAAADKALLRKAAFEKCQPLIKTDNAKMEAFKACMKQATAR